MIFTGCYASQNTDSVAKIAKAALEKNYKVNIFCLADGVYNCVSQQRVTGVPSAEKQFKEIIKKGARVDACGACLVFRGVKDKNLIRGVKPSAMHYYCNMIKESDRFITFSF
jgi:tRNA 2-thiouridine synthesizing protein D